MNLLHDRPAGFLREQARRWRCSQINGLGVAATPLRLACSVLVVVLFQSSSTFGQAPPNDNFANRIELVATTAISTNADNTFAVALGDVNGDGRPDLITGNLGQRLRLYTNNGTADPFRGVTASYITTDVYQTWSIVLGDVNGDGKLDLITGNLNQPLRLYTNNGTADPFNGIAGQNISSDANAAFSVVLGDVNGDGKLDLIAGNGVASYRTRLYLNNGTADPFSGVSGISINSTNLDTRALVLGDVNGDNKLDLILGNYGSPPKLYTNNGTANPFTGQSGVNIGADIFNTRALVLGDVNGDGKQDLIVGNLGQPLRLYTNSGTANPFDGVSGSNISNDANQTTSLALGDVNGDGKPDLIAGNDSQPNRVYLNNGTTDPFNGISGGNISLDGWVTLSVALQDVNGDGLLDLVAGIMNQTSQLYLNYGTPNPFNGVSLSVTGSNTNATKETGEPYHANKPDGKSVWWTWTAPTSTLVIIDTIGSSFDTLLAVYTGNSVSNLTQVFSDDDGGGNLRSRVMFFADAGTTYQIAVDGYNSATGSIVLNLRGAEFVSPQITSQPQNQSLIIGSTATLNVTVTGTIPLAFQWRHGGADITGATNSNYTIPNVQMSDVGAYAVLVRNVVGSIISSDAVLFVLPPPPLNDKFANRTLITGLTNTVAGNNIGAGKELGEPNHNGDAGGASVWWSWTAPTNGSVLIDTFGSSFQTLLAVYSGDTLLSLSNVSSIGRNDSFGASYVYPCRAGDSYQIAVDGISGAVGSIVLHIREVSSPPQITIQPESFSLAVGDSVSFYAGAVGTEPFNYQWRKDDIDVVGANSRTYHLDAVQITDTGTYCLVVSNMFGTTISSNAILSVIPQSYTAPYIFSTLAGYPGFGDEDGIGGNAHFHYPSGVCVDAHGNLFVADTLNSTIRLITPAGVVSTIAGLAESTGDTDGEGKVARFNYPYGIVVDANTNLFVGDYYNYTIRKVSPNGTNWIVSTIAGMPGDEGSQDGFGSEARFSRIANLHIDHNANLYVADLGNSIVRKVTWEGSNWMVLTIAGAAGNHGIVDGIGTNAQFYAPEGVAIDSSGNLYVADGKIRKIISFGTNYVVSTLTNVNVNDARAIASDSAGNLYVSDNYAVQKLVPAGDGWAVVTLAGQLGVYGNRDETGTNALFGGGSDFFGVPFSLDVDQLGNVYVADTFNSTIRKLTSAGVVSTVAGSAIASTAHVDGTGAAARFAYPQCAAVDSKGNIYTGDSYLDTLRKISPAGVVSTLAGKFPGAIDGVGSNARFQGICGIALDGADNIYIADCGACGIRRCTPAGVVTTIAGTLNSCGYTNGSSDEALFAGLSGVAVDSATNIYVTESINHTIRKLTNVGTNWQVSTIAGLVGNSGNADGTNSNARFSSPSAVAIDAATNLYVVDMGNHTIRRMVLSGTNWVVSTIAGHAGNAGSADGAGANARFYSPAEIAVDRAGDLYVADSGNQTIRKITHIGDGWVVSTIGGLARNQGAANGVGSAARFDNPGGIALDAVGNVFVVDSGNNTIRKGVFAQYSPARLVAFSQPPMNAQLAVTLLPMEANGQWRFPWELGWRNSGQAATNLVAGNYPVEFRTEPGWLAIPPSLTVAVTNGGTTFVTNLYFPTLASINTNDAGTLTVNLGPSPPVGAGWKFVGDGPPFLPSGYSINLVPGTYLIEFATVPGRTKPPSQAVQVNAGSISAVSVNYLLAQSPPGGVLLPGLVPTNNINDLNNYPFGFNGQLQSDVGYGSGVAVHDNVVLTAAHLIFNDQTLSYVNQAYWFFQREAGIFEPQPIPARGWYVLSGYAAQRTNDLQIYAPDVSTPQSRSLDVAALYFLQPVAGGGYGGYLPSDAVPNPWLASTALKMLVGYPVDGSQFGDASIVPGRMYQTDPKPDALSLAADPVANQQVYTAPWFLSYPGNSGGPLYVQFNGYYYPAAVYLGTLYSGITPYASAVRAIDSNVVNLITRAATLGDTGTNNTGGGVITIIPSQNISATNQGYVQPQLGPPSAIQAGAAWKISGDPDFSTGTNYVRSITSTNAVVVEYKALAGWNLPMNQTFTIIPGQIAKPSGFYTVTNPVLRASAQALGLTGTTGTTYRVETRNSLTSGTWQPLSTNVILTNGFNLVLPNPATSGPTRFYRAVWLP